MSYLETIEKYYEEQIAGWKKNLEDAPAKLEKRRQIADVLDEITQEVTPIYNWIGMLRMEFIFKSVEEAREITEKLLERLGVEKAEKGFDGWRDTPQWYYTISYKGQELRISPAEPSEDCELVPKATASTYWVCKKR